MTYTMMDSWTLAQRAVCVNDLQDAAHADEALFNVFFENQKRFHPTYNNTVRKISEVHRQIEERDILTHLVREIFGLNARELDYQYELRDAEYDALVQMGRVASQQKEDMLNAATRIHFWLEPDDDWPDPRGPLMRMHP